MNTKWNLLLRSKSHQFHIDGLLPDCVVTWLCSFSLLTVLHLSTSVMKDQYHTENVTSLMRYVYCNIIASVFLYTFQVRWPIIMTLIYVVHVHVQEIWNDVIGREFNALIHICTHVHMCIVYMHAQATHGAIFVLVFIKLHTYM